MYFSKNRAPRTTPGEDRCSAGCKGNWGHLCPRPHCPAPRAGWSPGQGGVGRGPSRSPLQSTAGHRPGLCRTRTREPHSPSLRPGTPLTCLGIQEPAVVTRSHYPSAPTGQHKPGRPSTHTERPSSAGRNKIPLHRSAPLHLPFPAQTALSAYRLHGLAQNPPRGSPPLSCRNGITAKVTAVPGRFCRPADTDPTCSFSPAPPRSARSCALVSSTASPGASSPQRPLRPETKGARCSGGEPLDDPHSGCAARTLGQASSPTRTRGLHGGNGEQWCWAFRGISFKSKEKCRDLMLFSQTFSKPPGNQKVLCWSSVTFANKSSISPSRRSPRASQDNPAPSETSNAQDRAGRAARAVPPQNRPPLPSALCAHRGAVLTGVLCTAWPPRGKPASLPCQLRPRLASRQTVTLTEDRPVG